MKQWIKENKAELSILASCIILTLLIAYCIALDKKNIARTERHNKWMQEQQYDIGYLDGANDTVDAVNNQVAGRGNILEFYTNKFVYSTNYGKCVTKRMATNYFNK